MQTRYFYMIHTILFCFAIKGSKESRDYNSIKTFDHLLYWVPSSFIDYNKPDVDPYQYQTVTFGAEKHHEIFNKVQSDDSNIRESKFEHHSTGQINNGPNMQSYTQIQESSEENQTFLLNITSQNQNDGVDIHMDTLSTPDMNKNENIPETSKNYNKKPEDVLEKITNDSDDNNNIENFINNQDIITIDLFAPNEPQEKLETSTQNFTDLNETKNSCINQSATIIYIITPNDIYDLLQIIFKNRPELLKHNYSPQIVNQIFMDIKLFFEFLKVIFEIRNEKKFENVLAKIVCFTNLVQTEKIYKTVKEQRYSLRQEPESFRKKSKSTGETCNKITLCNSNGVENQKKKTHIVRKMFKNNFGCEIKCWNLLNDYENCLDEISIIDEIHGVRVKNDDLKLKMFFKNNMSNHLKQENCKSILSRVYKYLCKIEWELNYTDLIKIFVFSMKFKHFTPSMLSLKYDNYIEKWYEIASIYDFIIQSKTCVEGVYNNYFQYKKPLLNQDLSRYYNEKYTNLINMRVYLLFKKRKAHMDDVHKLNKRPPKKLQKNNETRFKRKMKK